MTSIPGYYGGRKVTFKFQTPGKIEGVDLVNKTDVVIMGIPIRVHYTIHEPSYVEWTIPFPKDATSKQMELLNVLLRREWSGFIESVCREHAFYTAYADAQGHNDDFMDAMRHLPDVFSDKDNPF